LEDYKGHPAAFQLEGFVVGGRKIL